jgi:hypothetical protein
MAVLFIQHLYWYCNYVHYVAYVLLLYFRLFCVMCIILCQLYVDRGVSRGQRGGSLTDKWRSLSRYSSLAD